MGIPITRRSAVAAILAATAIDLGASIIHYQNRPMYPICYELAGGENPTNQISYVALGEALNISRLSSPIRRGYAFDGWFTDNGFSKSAEYVIGSDNPNSRTLFAKWNTIEFRISYDLDGGASEAPLPESYTVEDDISFPSPTKDGYEFGGWYSDKDFTERISDISPGTVGDLQLFAQWKLLSHWEPYIQKRCEEINSYISSSTNSELLTFIFISDVHLPNNNQYSPILIERISHDCGIEKVFCGGDIVNWNERKEDALTLLESWYHRFPQPMMFPIRGNHDSNNQNRPSICDPIPDEELRTTIFPDKIDNGVEGFYYFYDDAKTKTRYIVLDTGAPEDAPLLESQISWLRDRIETLGPDWAILVFTHIFFVTKESSDGGRIITTTEKGSMIQGCLDSALDSCEAEIVGVFSGHCHTDYLTNSDRGYFIAATTCDAGDDQSLLFDAENPFRTPGTTDEQAFDVAVIDKKARSLKLFRIGAGHDRTATY